MADEDDDAGGMEVLPRPLPKTAEFWKAMPSSKRLMYTLENRIGRPHIYDDPQDLLIDCLEYIQWCHENPMYETKFIVVGKRIEEQSIPHMRACTLNGLQVFLRLSVSTWFRMAGKANDPQSLAVPYAPGIKEVCQHVEQLLWEQKFAGAAADMLNAAIIMRALGLAEKKELSGPGGAPVQIITHEMTPVQAAETWADIVRSEDVIEQIEDQSES